MTTEDFTTAARAEAKDRWWNGAVPKDVNPPEAWILGFQEGAPWARDYLAAQEPTDTDTTLLQELIARALTEHWKRKHSTLLTSGPCSGCSRVAAEAVAAEVRRGKADA